MKIAFYCNYDNINIEDKVESLENGNIGLGGTQYLFLLIVSNLQKKYRNKKNEFILLTNKDINLEKNIIDYKVVKDSNDAWKWCDENKYDYFIIRECEICKFSDEYIGKMKTPVVLWAHNYVSKNVENILYRNNNIKKLICVSKQQYLNMKNSISYKKIYYINNCIGSYIDDEKKIEYRSDNEVATNIYYVGAIEPTKGVHNVIKIFSKIYKKNNNSKLFIIGGIKNLRGKVVEDITYFKYKDALEKIINKYKMKNNVEFLGILNSKQIKKVVENSNGIGLVSASKILMGETFCMTALELESYGLPIVSRKRKDGLNISVCDRKTGFLEITDKKIAKRIIQLQKDKNLYKNFSDNSIDYAKSFSVTRIIDEWYDFFCDVENIQREKKYTLIYKIKNKIGFNFQTIIQIVRRLQYKFLKLLYKKWER